MTHGTLKIYICDTQHLQHNGFTETGVFRVQLVNVTVHTRFLETKKLDEIAL